VFLFDAHLLTAVPLGFSESVPPLEEQLNPSDSSRSHCCYKIYLVARHKVGISDPAGSRTRKWVTKWAYQGPRH